MTLQRMHRMVIVDMVLYTHDKNSLSTNKIFKVHQIFFTQIHFRTTKQRRQVAPISPWAIRHLTLRQSAFLPSFSPLSLSHYGQYLAVICNKLAQTKKKKYLINIFYFFYFERNQKPNRLWLVWPYLNWNNNNKKLF